MPHWTNPNDTWQARHYNQVKAAGWNWNPLAKVWCHPNSPLFALNQHVVWKHVTDLLFVMPPCASTRDRCTTAMKQAAASIAAEVAREFNADARAAPRAHLSGGFTQTPWPRAARPTPPQAARGKLEPITDSNWQA